MTRLEDILRLISVALASAALLVAPWFFGSWEMWWFWPFTGAIFAATAAFGLRMALSTRNDASRIEFGRSTRLLLFVWTPFIAYALIRAVQAHVFMDAERSFLLRLTPILLASMIAIGFTKANRSTLAVLIMLDMALLGLYGIANHYLTGNAMVLWVPGYPQYQQGYHRATGSFFCPDHFAGMMELALAVAIGVLSASAVSTRVRAGAALVLAISVWGIVLSRSRGAGITVAVMLLAALWIAPASKPAPQRRRIRLAALLIVIAIAACVTVGGRHYLQRFKEYPWTNLELSDRYQMSAAALRGWQSAKWIGIGPGMHQNYWPHFAASGDGDRAKGIWPRYLNNSYHSYEAHNDWFQFLEEYGLLGVALFLGALGVTAARLAGNWFRPHSDSGSDQSPDDAVNTAFIPAALLCAVAMGVHSFGDFVLQIPANTWMLGGVAGLAIAAVADRRRSIRNGKSARHSTAEME